MKLFRRIALICAGVGIGMSFNKSGLFDQALLVNDSFCAGILFCALLNE